MDLSQLLDALAKPEAYAHTPSAVEVHQTHISVVFLVGSFAYKVKKPLVLGFVDYGSLEKRLHFCEEEVRLNRRLAPEVYLGVVPITQEDSAIRVEGNGKAIEWAVKMVRLPEAATLRARLRRREVGSTFLQKLAAKLAAFHAGAQAGPAIAAWGRFEVVARNALENFEQSAAHVGVTVSRPVFDRLHALVEARLADLRSLIEARAARGVPRDAHGDLRLDHVYVFPDRPPPSDLVVIDCIEFDQRYRCADPVSDMAFLVFDLKFHGHRNLAGPFATAYFQAAADAEGSRLLPLYASYRALVRAKVEGIKCQEKEVSDAERAESLRAARASWLLGLAELEAPGARPCLVMVGGLPGAGKSTLARGLASHAGFSVIRSDLVRKQLVGTPEETTAGAFEQGIYAPAWNQRTYEECLRRALALLFEGKRVLIDATFRAESHRRLFLEAAARFCVPAVLFLCQAAPAVVHKRLAERLADASDADWSVYERAAQAWEPPGQATQPVCVEIDTGGAAQTALSQALQKLTEWDLHA